MKSKNEHLSLNDLIRVGLDNIETATKVLTRAFHEYPTYQYCMPDPNDRRKSLAVLFNVLLKYTIKLGSVYATSSEIEGLMLLLPGASWEYSTKEMISLGALKFIFTPGIKFLLRVNPIEQKNEQFHKQHAPINHTYLWNFAVDPHFQGKGYARRMVDALQNSLREKNESCYLETEDPKLVSIYERFGFQLMETYSFPKGNLRQSSMLWNPIIKK